jgi:hypothetical protein
MIASPRCGKPHRFDPAGFQYFGSEDPKHEATIPAIRQESRGRINIFWQQYGVRRNPLRSINAAPEAYSSTLARTKRPVIDKGGPEGGQANFCWRLSASGCSFGSKADAATLDGKRPLLQTAPVNSVFAGRCAEG